MKKFKTWSQIEDLTWQKLAGRQLPNLDGKVSQIWVEGSKKLKLPENRVPDFDQVSKRLAALTGWTLTPTDLDFADGQTWFTLLKNKQMLITKYIRPLDSLDYTPMPDVFHDAFGHLPFFTNPSFCNMVSLFTERILAAPPKERAALGHLWWYSVEFGLIREDGEIKALGAGLVSSFAELNRFFNQQTKISPFEPDLVAHVESSHDQFHQQLFVLDSLDQLVEIIKNWTLQG